MPGTLFPEMEHGSGTGLDDQRALQALALDLSMLGLTSEDDGSSTFDENRAKRSCNMTECVPVPSSEHVAEIVGRQGCKIKALRAKTNTYIKTPVRGEEPIFVVTGRKEDVTAAKREILSAAEHFSQIRARRNNQGTHNGTGVPPGPPAPNVPGQTTIQVRVPYRVVGLVVGPKGATIKRIQQQTSTYIVTPSRDNEPVFEVTGMPDNVERAREEIEAHIAMRTGGLIDSSVDLENDFETNGKDTGLFNTFGEVPAGLNQMGVYKQPTPPPPTSTTLVNGFNPLIGSMNPDGTLQRTNSEHSYFFPTSNGTSTTKLDFNPLAVPFNGSATTTNGQISYDLFGCPSPDLGIDSPGFDMGNVGPGSLWQQGVNPAVIHHLNGLNGNIRRNSASSSSHGVSIPEDNGSNDHPPARRIRSDPLDGGLSALPSFPQLPGSFPSTTTSGSSCSSPTDSIGSASAPKKSKECMVCYESQVVAALVPCGHNLFCMECANRLVEKSPATCPICHQSITQAIRIFS